MTSEDIELIIHSVDVAESKEGYQEVRLKTNRGTVEGRYYPVADTTKAAIWVGGAGGGWDSPARGLYPRLCQDLQRNGIASLRIRFRKANDLLDCTLDVVAGIAFLEAEDIERIALAGHSFGGAVVVQAGTNSDITRTVIMLATQSAGIQPISQLPEGCSTLLIHGGSDHILPQHCSEYAFALAHNPKEIVIYPHADHGLDEVAGDVYQKVRQWVIQELG